MRNVEIKGIGTSLPQNKIEINGQVRYRVENNEKENQLTLSVKAIHNALKDANMEISDIDLIVSASAVGIQPIPCMAVLIHEQIAKGTSIPAMDINTTCTSFITAFDTISYLIEADRYKNVIIVSCDLASSGLNPNQKESYELFGDGAAAIILSKSTRKDVGVLYSIQRTWSEGAHSTEIRGGLTGMHPKNYNENTIADYLFDMRGREVLTIAARKLPRMFEDFYKESNLSIDSIDMVIPHQASKALGMIMKKIGIPENKYIDIVKDYGNMVSASVPFTLCKTIEKGKIKKGDMVLLCGTAAGLTANVLVFKY